MGMGMVVSSRLLAAIMTLIPLGFMADRAQAQSLEFGSLGLAGSASAQAVCNICGPAFDYNFALPALGASGGFPTVNPPYSISLSRAAFSGSGQSTFGPAVFTATVSEGPMSAQASSPYPGAETAQGYAEVDNYAFSLVENNGGVITNIITINAAKIVSSSSISVSPSGAGFLANLSGFTEIDGLTMTGAAMNGADIVDQTYLPTDNVIIPVSYDLDEFQCKVCTSLHVGGGARTGSSSSSLFVPDSGGSESTAAVPLGISFDIRDFVGANPTEFVGAVEPVQSSARVQVIPAPTPEPQTWAVLVVGLCGVGGVLRSRRGRLAT